VPLPTVDLFPFINPARISILTGSISKVSLLRHLTDVVIASGQIADADSFRHAIAEREEVTSTAIGGGIAIPHARLPYIQGFVLALAVIPDGVDFHALDCAPVRLAVMIAAPEDERDRYLHVLAAVATRLSNPTRREKIIAVGDIHGMLDAFLA
jgi:mannitol/fructose-specific phosphotransferase system IIA component (Ntr-type)